MCYKTAIKVTEHLHGYMVQAKCDCGTLDKQTWVATQEEVGDWILSGNICPASEAQEMRND